MVGERRRLSFNFMLSADAQAGDQVDDLRDQIEAHGHTFAVTRGQFLPPPWYNVFSEGVSEVMRHPDRLHEMARAGYGLIALVTEEPTLVTGEGLVWNYMTTGTWERRAELFVQIAPALTAAWCYVPGAAAVLRRVVKNSSAVDLAWGQRFNRPRPSQVPRFDFCFFGGMTPRREQLLGEIAKRYKVDVIPHSTTLAKRDERIPHSKIVLDIKQYHWWDLVSSVRYVTALCCGRPVVAEWRSSRARLGWGAAVLFAPLGQLTQIAAAELERGATLYDREVAGLRAMPDTMGTAIGGLPAIPEKPVNVVSWPPAAAAAAAAQVVVPVPPGHRPAGGPPRLVETQPGMNFVEWRGDIYAIPQRVGKIELDRADISRFPGIKKFRDLVTAKNGTRKR